MKQKTGYFAFLLNLLRYKPGTTAVDILCNVWIMGHAAAVALLVRQILNSLTPGNQGVAFQGAVPFLLLILGVGLFRVVTILLCAVLDGKRGYYYGNRTRLNLFQRLLQKEDVTRVSGDSGRIFEALDDDVPCAVFPAELFTEVASFTIYALATLGILLSVSWQLTLFLFLPLSAAIFGVQKLTEKLQERRRANRAAHDEVSAFVGDVTGAVLSIKTAGATDAVLGAFTKKTDGRRAALLRDLRFNAQISVLLQLTVQVGVAVIMFAAAQGLGTGQMRMGDFSLFIMGLGTLGGCIDRIAELFCFGKKGQVSYERILNAAQETEQAFLVKEANLFTGKTVACTPQPVEKISFTEFTASSLSFCYGAEQAFCGVNLQVTPGKLVVVAGGVGSGKSTLLHVLSGNLPLTEGQLCWNGTQIPGSGPYLLPPNTAFASQRARFLSVSLGENLLLGQKEAPMEEALRLAELTDTVAQMPEGLSTQVGSRGRRLSGGQLQRAALARVYLLNPSLYLIDDCLSAMDEKTRAQVCGNLLAKLAKDGSGAVVATNFRPFLQAADHILLLHKGQVAAEGTYDTLLKESAEFRAILS